MTDYVPLRMTAEDRDDLHIMSACLQDALVPLSGLEYDKEAGRFHLIVNRFCWECDPETYAETCYHARVTAGLSFHHVRDVQKKEIELQNREELINLLTIQGDEGEDDGASVNTLTLIFSGGAEIKLTVDKLSCHLKDMEEPYATAHKPSHEGK